MRNRVCLAAAVLCALAGAPAASAQVRTGSVLDRRVTVSFQQAPLESVLRTLRRQYGVRISYSNTALNLRQPVTLSAQNQPLRTVLSEVLEGKNIGYELVGDQLVLHPAAPRAAAKPADAAPAASTTTTISKAAERPAETPPTPKPLPASEPTKPASLPNPAPTRKKPTSTSSKPTGATSVPSATASTTSGGKAGSSKAPRSKAVSKPDAPANQTANAAPVGTVAATAAPTPAADSARAAQPAPAPADAEESARPTYTQPAQISLLGPLGSNGLRSGQTVNHLSVNILGGYAAGVEGVEVGGLFNIDRDTVDGAQLAGLGNYVGRHLDGFQAAGLLNVLGGGGKGWQAAGLLNIATRPIAGAQTAGLFNYVGPRKKPGNEAPVLEANAAPAISAETAPAPSSRASVQAAGLFNVALTDVRGGQAAGLFNVAKTTHGLQAAGLLNVAHTSHGVQLAGLLNIADSVQGVSIAPLNFVRRGYHRLEVTYSETWPITASLKLGGSAAFYTFFTGAYAGFGSGPRRWALGYGAGTDMWAQRRFSLSLDAVTMHVNEEQRHWTDALNLHNQLRLLVGITPFKASSHVRIVAGPTVSVLVTQRYDTAEGGVYSNLSAGRKLWLNEGNARTRVLGWFGYSVGVRL
ncbi:DUF4974 domain-containing protein [Hymenobacter sp. CRA2]|uniref:DUF4974 domain-containing protein n=1 Tax=Hymenobacter sp. CRA2 TaxID=1955620 RepID=UPI0009902D60|nr:DUF4974 domain-containing protein [Hymenobacter sp. CRA2]OON70549.1 hypothetical protein B0919_00545 [Hymenobacter sp. CRA2]